MYFVKIVVMVIGVFDYDYVVFVKGDGIVFKDFLDFFVDIDCCFFIFVYIGDM